jgi:hypothetical protein
MRISGHRTDSMFRRYDICNEEDLAQAMLSLERYHKAAATEQKVATFHATVDQQQQKQRVALERATLYKSAS